MKILVTGGCGFLGSHVCQLFKEKGWDVVAYDNMSKHELMRTGYNVEAARNYNTKFLESIGVEVVVGDIRDDDRLLDVASGCGYIVNCAAQPAMTIAIERPSFDCDNNVMGTVNVLDAGRILKIPVAICSTIHVYGNGINEDLTEEEDRFYLRSVMSQGISEDDNILTGTLTPLHASKRAAEIYAQAYTDTYNSKVAVFRLTGIYGPRQLGGEDHGWVANFAIRTIFGLPIKVFGTDKQVRDILYVEDAAHSFLDWYQNGCPSGVYNIGGGEPCITSIKQCLQMLQKLVPRARQVITLEPKRSGDLWYFCCDIDKATETFGWRPYILPTDGIANLVNWILQNRRLFE